MPDTGTATIVYDDPDGKVQERAVENDDIVYFDDHWLVKVGENDDGDDVVRRIPRERVHHVERSIDELEKKVEGAIEKAKEQVGWSA
ncbi:hypothetical protein ZOD2009_07594 [Haladaptatus paucihalophilus DX253]|uniref:Uncharacterized protein n=1 Tax=Haladaptatus paucihalophilus DX253 TaxID=797209 RepID=E7QRU6_HALPU|nr:MULTISPECIES: hypothetical protein [Haladaptatus]EFW92715.1 hypothetical protein ZOD2009_07594 [Haladaptatus paucihalophilus DX253]ODR82062.1 hypothetical protein BG842_22765 [Haladaptatus sp. W1]GKZ13687.1 hypothetical protein HAL_15680 [Haladaptatus sp. T7]SHK14809.1 hypothetical protein SAMN05444342_0742 [Haladaptatus paucihalophilus DX253]